ncbi:Uncharacterised protein [Mycobacteroides abscessus]|nr:Uncharacterised protein [Mycobacteroides abscessus]
MPDPTRSAFAVVARTASGERSTATTREPGTSTSTLIPMTPEPQHRSTTSGGRSARPGSPRSRAASSIATCATVSVSGRGTKTSSSTSTVTCRNTVCPTMRWSGSRPRRRSTASA